MSQEHAPERSKQIRTSSSRLSVDEPLKATELEAARVKREERRKQAEAARLKREEYRRQRKVLEPDHRHRLYRFSDLQTLQIVNNRAQLKNMIERDGFPAGFILGPQTRAWRADDIEAWLANRPTAKIEARGRAKALVQGTARPAIRKKQTAHVEASDR